MELQEIIERLKSLPSFEDDRGTELVFLDDVLELIKELEATKGTAGAGLFNSAMRGLKL